MRTIIRINTIKVLIIGHAALYNESIRSLEGATMSYKEEAIERILALTEEEAAAFIEWLGKHPTFEGMQQPDLRTLP